MIIIEFPLELNQNSNVIRYRNILNNHNEDLNWHIILCDFQTLNYIINNFGIIGTVLYLSNKKCQELCVDNPSTSDIINVSYCGANIKLLCSKYLNSNTVKKHKALNHLIQNF